MKRGIRGEEKFILLGTSGIGVNTPNSRITLSFDGRFVDKDNQSVTLFFEYTTCEKFPMFKFRTPFISFRPNFGLKISVTLGKH